MNAVDLLKQMVEDGCSDLIIKAGSPPIYRQYGELITQDSPFFEADQTQNIAQQILAPEEFERFKKDLEIDLVYEIKGLSRFRVNVLKQRTTISLVFRRIPKTIPTVDELHLPESVKDFALRPRGLVLVTGPAGCGKSTTLASLVDYRNCLEDCHIITIEDPVEFLYESKKAVINQRQIGRDTDSFSQALKHVLRQDPDIIVIGDMRDLETISLAITAAETGHLVLANLHTTDAVSTINRIIDAFPPYQQQQIKMQISVNLVGIVSQILVKKDPGPGRVPAFEVMVATLAARNLIREGKNFQLSQLLETQVAQGMCSMNQSLMKLVRDNITTHEQIKLYTDSLELEDINQQSTGW